MQERQLEPPQKVVGDGLHRDGASFLTCVVLGVSRF